MTDEDIDEEVVRSFIEAQRRHLTVATPAALESFDRIINELRLLRAARDIQAMAYQPEENL